MDSDPRCSCSGGAEREKMDPFYSLLIAATLLLFRPCEGRIVGRCFQEIEGSRCHGKGMSWQHDGVCVVNEQNIPQCTVPDTATFKLAVIAKLRQLKRLPGSEFVSTLWMRGSGPGLSWEKSVELKKTAVSVDTWRAELSYSSTSDSLPCLSPSQCTMNQGALEFRLYRDKLGIETMLGPNFYIPLPISRSLAGAVDFLTPKVTVYPWFDGDKIRITRFTLEHRTQLSQDTLKLNVTLLYPPSFDHNVRKSYPLVILFGKKEPAYISPLLEHMFIHEASIQEAVVAVIEYLDTAPFCFFNPIQHPWYGGGNVWRCKAGRSTCHDCQSCWDNRRTEACDKDEFIQKAMNCLTYDHCKGRGEVMLNLIESSLLPELLERTANRLLVDFPRQRISIIGMDGAGLLACYAAVTRPVVYGNAGCLSAPFAWPIRSLEIDPVAHMGKILYQLNISLLAQPGLQMQYLTQKYYIDTGERDNFFFPVIDAHRYTHWFIDKLQEQLGLQMDENIVYANIPKMSNSYYHHPYHAQRILHTIRHPLRFFLRAEGGPNREFSRMLHLSEESYGERSAQLELSSGVVHQLGEGTQTLWTNHCTEAAPGHDKKSSNDVPLPVFLSVLGKCS